MKFISKFLTKPPFFTGFFGLRRFFSAGVQSWLNHQKPKRYGTKNILYVFTCESEDVGIKKPTEMHTRRSNSRMTVHAELAE